LRSRDIPSSHANSLVENQRSEENIHEGFNKGREKSVQHNVDIGGTNCIADFAG
jgi:hypothetical protein